MIGILLCQCNRSIRVKLLTYQHKANFDLYLLFIFQHLPFHSAQYWRFVVVFEVSIKQKGYLLLIMFMAFINIISDCKIAQCQTQMTYIRELYEQARPDSDVYQKLFQAMDVEFER